MVPDFVELERSILQAVVGRRWDDLADLLEDNFVITTAGWLNKPATKQAWIEELAAHQRIHKFEIQSVDVQKMGTVTVALVLSTQWATVNGAPFTGDFRYTDVWRPDDANRWRLAVRHASLLPPPPLPPGYHSVNPYIVVDRADEFIAFVLAVFEGTENGERQLRDDGAIDHANIVIGDSHVMISEGSATYPARPCVHFVFVDYVDSTHARAMRAGSRSILSPTNQAWGDRVGGIVDPFENRWWIATHLPDRTPP